MTRKVNVQLSNNLRRLWQVLVLFITTIITFPIFWHTRPEEPALKRLLNPNFLGFFELYRRIDKYFLLVGTICSYTEWYYSGSIFTNLPRILLIMGQIFANFSYKCCHYLQNLDYYITLDSDFEVL